VKLERASAARWVMRAAKEGGNYLEEAAFDYREQLMDLFAASPEGQALLDQGDDLGWANMMLDYGITYPATK